MHEVQVKPLVELAQEKSVVRRTDRPNMTIAVDWDVKNQPKQNIHQYTSPNENFEYGYPHSNTHRTALVHCKKKFPSQIEVLQAA